MIINTLISAITAAAISLTAGFAMPADTNAEPTVSAKGCVVIDALTGDVLYGKNEQEQLPMASTTKIMSAYLALAQDGLDIPFTVDSEAIRVEGSSMGLQEGDTVTLRTLAAGMLLPSGNDAANAAAVRVAGSVPEFVQLMNDTAKELGLESTHFETPSGLDDYTDSHLSTALDMARLTREALKSEEFCRICGSKSLEVEFGAPPYKRWLTNTNKLLAMCEGCIGVKTGFTDKAGRCLVSACRRDGALLICVTLNDRNDWADHQALYDYCFKQLKQVPLTPELSGYRIPLAAAGGYALAEGETDKLLLPETALPRLQRVTLIKPFLYSAEAGQTVGETRFYIDGQIIAKLPVSTIKKS